MTFVHYSRSSAQVKNAEHFYLSEARNSPSRRLSECLSSPILWASKEWDEGFIARLKSNKTLLRGRAAPFQTK